MRESSFSERLARVKLADRPVVWHEAYTDRTEFLKNQFDDVVGPGSYFRFEGRDTDAGDEYFAVIGPAKIRAPKAMFFAGVRKLPSDYAAGGLYFAEMREAIKYAEETWGVSVPKDAGYYDSSDLRGLGKRIKEWKKVKDEGGGEEAATQPIISAEAPVMSSSIDDLSKFSMAERLVSRTGYTWFDLDKILDGDPAFERAKQGMPSLGSALDVALDERATRRLQISGYYGSEYVEADFYKIWIAHKDDEGTYLVVVGPYLSRHPATPEGQARSKQERFESAVDKFYAGTKKLNVASQEEIDEKINSLIEQYAREYGVRLTRDDIKVNLEENPMVGQVSVGRTGRDKIYNSPQWQQRVLGFYGIQPGAGAITRAKAEYKVRKAQWKAQMEEAYRVSQENGDAFLNQQPPPPRVDLEKRAYGQQQFVSIFREEKPADVSGERAATVYGFDSVREAVNRLVSTLFPGLPVAEGDIPTTTSEDLHRARMATRARVESGEESAVAEEPVATPPRTEPSRVTRPPAAEPPDEAPEAKKPKAPAKAPAKEAPKAAPKMPPAQVAGGGDDDDYDVPSFFAQTIERLVKLAASFDDEGMHDKAEEIHRILRKHVSF